MAAAGHDAAGPALNRSASIDRIPAEARRILHRLAGELWGADVDPAALVVSQLKGALTNEVFRVTWPGGEGDPRKVLVRIYCQGIDVFFDRADEVRTFECMSRHGQGPRLLGRFPQGRVEEFINARTLSAPDLRDQEISALIASKLREFHEPTCLDPRTSRCGRGSGGGLRKLVAGARLTRPGNSGWRRLAMRSRSWRKHCRGSIRE